MKISGDELVHDKEDMKEIKLIEEFRGNRVREVLDERVAQSKNLCDLMKPFQGGIRTNLFNRHNRQNYQEARLIQPHPGALATHIGDGDKWRS